MSALLAAVLAYSGIADLAASSMDRRVSAQFWSVQAPFRTAFFLALCIWSYASRPGGLSMDRTEAFRLSMVKGVGEGPGNGVILTWALIEMMVWFWVSPGCLNRNPF